MNLPHSTVSSTSTSCRPWASSRWRWNRARAVGRTAPSATTRCVCACPARRSSRSPTSSRSACRSAATVTSRPNPPAAWSARARSSACWTTRARSSSPSMSTRSCCGSAARATWTTPSQQPALRRGAQSPRTVDGDLLRGAAVQRGLALRHHALDQRQGDRHLDQPRRLRRQALAADAGLVQVDRTTHGLLKQWSVGSRAR